MEITGYMYRRQFTAARLYLEAGVEMNIFIMFYNHSATNGICRRPLDAQKV